MFLSSYKEWTLTSLTLLPAATALSCPLGLWNCPETPVQCSHLEGWDAEASSFVGLVVVGVRDVSFLITHHILEIYF